MTNLKYDDRDNTICWETACSSDFIELRPNEDGLVMIDTIEALAALPLKADALKIPCTGAQIIGGLYKTRAQALDQLPRAVIELSRGRDIVANWRTLNF